MMNLNDLTKPSDPPKVLKSDTRQWTSGSVKFALLGWAGKPDQNYIIFEKTYKGKGGISQFQKFNMRLKDWRNLKALIDGELSKESSWIQESLVVDQESLSKLIIADPGVLEKVLANKNILKLSNASLEALDGLAVKLYEVKADKIDLIFKKLSQATGVDLESFGTLLEDLKLNQVSMMASIVYQKLKVIGLLEATCMTPGKLEKDVHKIFESNIWLAGKNYDVVQSDRTLANYLDTNTVIDPDTSKRPDLIVKTIPNTNDIVLIELKGPGIKLKAKHIGQVLEYKALIQKIKPNIGQIHCYLFGSEKDTTFILSNDVEIKTFSELITEARSEYQQYQLVLDQSKETSESVMEQY